MKTNINTINTIKLEQLEILLKIFNLKKKSNLLNKLDIRH